MEKLFDLLREDFKEQKQDIKDIALKVDALIAAQNKRIGISIASSFIFSVLFGLVVAFIERH